MARRILVATDGSACAEAAVDAAVGLAHDSGASIVGLHVTALASLMNEGSAVSASAYAQEPHACLGYVERRAAQARVPVEVATRRADAPSAAILAAAHELQCNLIAMGAHGADAHARRTLGSQTATVLAHCTVPVLVVPLRHPDT